jgi:RNA polymerase sigma-70 factor (ECF subfamily)
MRAEIEQAVEILRGKDPQALDKALALLQGTVFSFSMKVCGHREDAEDAMQEVLMKSVRFLPQFDNSKALAVWLYKVARSRCLMSRRTSKFAPKEKLSLENLQPDRSEFAGLTHGARATPESYVLQGEGARRLQQAVTKLPLEYRLVLILHDMEELSDKEIAEIMHLQPGTVRVRLHRARLFVRKELARRDSHGFSRKRREERAEKQSSEHRPGRCKTMFAELSDYLDGVLDDSLCEELEKHLGGCQACQAFLSSLEDTVRRCRQAPKACPDAGKAVALRKVLRTEMERVLAGRM